ncbi:hypothetical protein [Moraxella lacunata]|uniref:hypothetical protein n=1 Tax=Moraxella lacunata TaxID=477 RepID=UPI003EE186C9
MTKAEYFMSSALPEPRSRLLNTMTTTVIITSHNRMFFAMSFTKGFLFLAFDTTLIEDLKIENGANRAIVHTKRHCF